MAHEASGVRLHRFTVDEYHRMAGAGILTEDSRVELIRGRIIDMAPIGAPHLGMVNRLNRLLSALLAGRAIVSVQNPVRLDDGSEPEPDIAVLRPRDDDYASATPRADDVLLVIEVADTSLADDRAIKAPLYGESGIAEFWIVNLVENVVEVHRRPEPSGYGSVRRAVAGDALDISMVPGAALPAADVLQPGGEPTRR